MFVHSHRAGPTQAVGVLRADPDPPRSNPASVSASKHGWRFAVLVPSRMISLWTHAYWSDRCRVSPEIAKLPQLRSRVKPAGRMIDAHRMKRFDVGEKLGHVCVSADDASPYPVTPTIPPCFQGSLVVKRKLLNSNQILGGLTLLCRSL